MADNQTTKEDANPTAQQTLLTGDDEDQNDPKDGLVHVTEGYYKYTDVLFDWPKCLSVWQRNAVKPLLNGEVMVRADHPLHIPGQQGIELYLSTAANGHQRLLFSLKQLEYLQYYIHEHKLADPKVVRDMMGGDDAGWPEDFDFDAIVDEGRIPLPLNPLLPADLGVIKPVNYTSLAGMKKELARIGRHNKSVKREANLMRPIPSDRVKTEAELDNAREGPGLRKGPIRRRVYDWEAEDEDEHVPGPPDAWANYSSPAPASDAAGGVSSHSMPETPEISIPPSPDLSDSLSNSLNLSTPPSILEKHEPDTPAEHYYHAQQALLLASQGGLVAALSRQTENAPEGEPTEDEKKIGRSLFVALDVVTSEQDESVVLEIGWSALWWQPVKPGDLTGEFEEMRDQGHYVMQEHLLTLKNGEIKPDHRDRYQFGTSLPVKAGDVNSILSQLLADMSKKAGGGLTYVVCHLPRLTEVEKQTVVMSGTMVDLLKIGLFPHEFHQTLRPTSTQYPIYSESRGIGRTSVINTATLLEHVKSSGDGNRDEQPAKSPPLEKLATDLFPAGDERAPKYLGNAGNKASCALEIMLSLLMEHEPSGPLSAGDGADATVVTDKASGKDDALASNNEIVKGPVSASTADFVEVREHDPDASHQSESDSEGEGIQGVFFKDDDGEMVELDDDEKSA